MERIERLQIEEAAGLIEDAYATEPGGVPDMATEGWLEDTLNLLRDCGLPDGGVGFVAKVYVDHFNSLRARLHPEHKTTSEQKGVVVLDVLSELFAERLAAELGAPLRYTDTTAVITVSEALSAEVSQCSDGDVTVGLSGLSREYRHYSGGPGDVILAALFVRRALHHIDDEATTEEG